MVKTPRTRHAKGSRPPVTIDLEAAESRPVEAGETPSTSSDEPSAASEASQRLVEPMEVAEARDADAPAPAEAPDATLLGDVEAQGRTSEASEADDPATAESVPPQPADDPEPAIETGTAIPSDQEYRSSESMASATGAVSEPEQPASSEQSKQATSTPLPPPPVRRSDGMGRVVAGVIGGVVALAVAGGMQAAGLLGHPGGGGASPDQSGEIAGLRQEIEALKSAGAAPQTDPRIEELGQSLDTLRTELASLRESVPAAGPETEGLGPRLDSLESEVERVSSAMPTPEELSALGERIAAAETESRAAQEASTTAADRLSTLEQSVSSLQARVDAQSQQPKIALAIATAALKAAVDRGSPFLAELETFAAIHPDTPEIEELRDAAESGVPTREALRVETDAAATAMIAAAAPADPNAGFLDRLMSSAESLVTVRPIGQVAGPGVPETIARMEVAINAGELEQALAEYETLPEPVKQAGAAFAARLKARADVERLVDQAIANAMRA